MDRTRIAVLVVTVAALTAAFFVLRPGSAPDVPARPGDPAAAPAGTPAAAQGPVTFAIAGRVEDHVVPAPCSRIPGGGLLSMKPFFDAAAKAAPPVLPVCLGDVTSVPGDLGRAIAGHHYTDVVQASDPKVMVAGAHDLSLGVEFVKSVLAERPYPVLCANATDAAGHPLLKGWQLIDVSGRTVLVVGSVADTLQDEVAADGSEIRLTAARDAVAVAVSEGEARARALERTLTGSVLFHQGTVAETAALLREVPGFALGVAARGTTLPPDPPETECGVPVIDAGRRLQFAWLATVEGGKTVRWSLVRLGIELLAAGSPVAETLDDHRYLVRDIVFPKVAGATKDKDAEDARPADPRGTYVGAQRCAACHSEECGEHASSAHGKLPDRFANESLGSAQCLACHVTAPFRRTGWKGRTDTSDLAGVSCEACHGPGAAHAETPGTPYGSFDLAQCRTCHTPDRAPDFDAEALWAQWKHAQKRPAQR